MDSSATSMRETSRRAASPASAMAVTSSAEASMAKNKPHNAIEPLIGFDATTLPLPRRSLGSASIQERRPSRNRASGTTSRRAFSVSLNRPPIAAVPRPTSPMRSAAVAIKRITRSHSGALRCCCSKVMPPVPFYRLMVTLSRGEHREPLSASYSRDIGAPSPSRGGGRRSQPIRSAWRSIAAPCRGCRTAPPPVPRRTGRDNDSVRAAARPRTL